MSLNSLLVLLVLLSSLPVRAATTGLQLYESGEYEAAAQVFAQVLTASDSTPEDRGRSRVYLAASLHALGRMEQAGEQLELLAREHPELRLDAARFLPDLVALAETIRQRVESERRDLELRAERERVARETPLQPSLQPVPTTSPSLPVLGARLRPEAFGFADTLGFLDSSQRSWRWGAGLAYGQGSLEGSARVWLGGVPVFHVQGGVLLGHGTAQPYLGLRAVLIPGGGRYGGGAVVGGRVSLPAGFVALMDVGVEYLPGADDSIRPLALTAVVGLGFDVQLQ
ncbi:hypothetical protein JRI60_20390 [Archangium violaceum]|uniref:tetratricopeptide repeat protein n=1 Tax=Archangium violaceum TaxID=83451 RepID=UPI0019523E39|nr:hypothetical protein [Archangium violaceum]QRO01217.1 hypothetical protein JRI60_20390 [Archangium violaceum]